MNAPTNTENRALMEVAAQDTLPRDMSTAALMLNGDAMERIFRFSQMMAKGAVTVPRHLQGNEADCLAITLQATQWGLNPFAVAQKTHLSQSGALGYEAQLISAVVTNSPHIIGDPEYEHIGDWSRILGKVEERKSDKGGKYYVATYTKAEEEGLGVICRLRLRGEAKPRALEVMMSQCYPRFSTQWATDPMQQITYVAIRKWARRFKPGIILGVLGDDEIEGGGQPKFMGPADVVPPVAPTTYPQADFERNLPIWLEVIAKGRKTVDDIINTANSKHPLTDAQQAAIREGAAKPKGKDQATDAEPKVTYAHVAEKLKAAQNMHQLAEAASLIAAVPEAQRDELTSLYDARGVALTQA